NDAVAGRGQGDDRDARFLSGRLERTCPKHGASVRNPRAPRRARGAGPCDRAHVATRWLGPTRAGRMAGSGGVCPRAQRQELWGFADWRLPTLEEAMSLMTTPDEGLSREGRRDDAPKEVYHLARVFERAGAYFMWTTDLLAPGRGWVVYFREGQ